MDKYLLGPPPGEGGMSVVYRARDESLQRDVAIKVMHAHLARDPEARQRFAREARAIARLTHRNIPEIFDFSASNADVNFIVSELVEGPSLSRLLREQPRLQPEVGVALSLGVARALAHAHAHGIIHRDVKPDNVLVGCDGVVRLTDFGIAQIVGLESMTMTGTLIGSPAHMAPEQIDGTRDLDARVDVWAFGTVLYMASTGGTLPFEGDNPHGVLKRIMDGDFRPARRVNPHVDSALERIVDRCLQVDRAARYPAMEPLIADLERWLDERGITDVEREIRALIADPPGYIRDLDARLIAMMMALGDEALETGHRHRALERYGRVLTLNPDHADAAERVRRLSSGLRARRVASIGALALFAAGTLTLIVLYALRPGPTPPIAAAALASHLDPPTAPHLDVVTSPNGPHGPGAPEPGRSAGALLGPTLAQAAAARPAREAAARRPPRPRPDPRPSSRPRADHRPVKVRLTAFPPAVQISVAGHTFPAGGTISLRPATYDVVLRHPQCPACPVNRHTLVVKSNPRMYIEVNYTFRYAPATLELRCAEGSYAMDDRGKRYACNKTYEIPVGTPRPQTMTLSLHSPDGALERRQSVLVRQNQRVVLKL